MIFEPNIQRLNFTRPLRLILFLVITVLHLVCSEQRVFYLYNICQLSGIHRWLAKSRRNNNTNTNIFSITRDILDEWYCCVHSTDVLTQHTHNPTTTAVERRKKNKHFMKIIVWLRAFMRVRVQPVVKELILHLLRRIDINFIDQLYIDFN